MTLDERKNATSAQIPVKITGNNDKSVETFLTQSELIEPVLPQAAQFFHNTHVHLHSWRCTSLMDLIQDTPLVK